MSVVQLDADSNDERAPVSQVITHEAPWVIYALGFSSRAAYPYRLGIGSFVEDVRNEIQVIQLNLDTENFETKVKFDHPFPATKLIWLPEKVWLSLCRTAPSPTCWRLPAKTSKSGRSSTTNKLS